MLRLAARPPVVDDQLARHRAGDVGAQILFDHGQRQIDPGGHAGRRPDRPVADEDAILLDPGLRVARLQRAGMVPVGGGTPAIEQAGLGEDERTRAGRGHPSGPGRGAPQESQQPRRGRRDAMAGALDQRVEVRRRPTPRSGPGRRSRSVSPRRSRTAHERRSAAHPEPNSPSRTPWSATAPAAGTREPPQSRYAACRLPKHDLKRRIYDISASRQAS